MSNVQTSVYPSVEEVMSLARSIVNDAFRGGAGRILTDQAPFTIPYINSALRTLQDKLANSGVSNFVKDNYLMLNVPPVPNPDPDIQVVIDWTGYRSTDGSVSSDKIYLPGDMLVPLDLRERLAGSPMRFTRMVTPQSGICSRQQTGPLMNWEWRNDGIWMNGATTNRDLNLRYEARLPLIASNADFSSTKINIRDSADAMAWRVAYLFASARGAQQAAQLNAEFEQAAARIVVRYTRRDQRLQFNRRPFGNYGDGVPIGIYKG